MYILYFAYQETEKQYEPAEPGERHRVSRHVQRLPLLVEAPRSRLDEVGGDEGAGAAQQVHHAAAGEVGVAQSSKPACKVQGDQYT